MWVHSSSAVCIVALAALLTGTILEVRANGAALVDAIEAHSNQILAGFAVACASNALIERSIRTRANFKIIIPKLVSLAANFISIQLCLLVMINCAEWTVSISIGGSPWRQGIACTSVERALVGCSSRTTDHFWKKASQSFACSTIIWTLIVQIWFFHAVLANASLN